MSDLVLLSIPLAVMALVTVFGFVGCTNRYDPFVVEDDGPNGTPTDPYAEVVKNSGPIAYWRLSDQPSPDPAQSAVANDEIPAQQPPGDHPGAYQGTVTLGVKPGLNDSDASATPARFDGSGFVFVDQAPAFALSQFTVEALVHPDSVDARGVVLSNLSSVSNMSSGGWALAVIPPPDPSNDGLFEGLARDGSGLVSLTAKFDFAGLGTAWHVAMTFDGMSLTLYKDGAEVGTAPVQTYVPNTEEPLQIGNGFKGAIQEVAVYDRALPAAEVGDHFTANTPPGS